jgi:hypothetical protein
MGSFLDRVGPRTASIFGGAMFGLGCVTFALGIVKPCTCTTGSSLQATWMLADRHDVQTSIPT